MKISWLLTLSIFICVSVYAQDSTIDGYDYTSAEMVEYHGIIGSPSTSATGYAKQYFDASSGKLKCSENGGAYADCVGGGSGGDASGWTDSGTIVYVTNTTENVAIGTTTPNATLKINNVTTSDSFRVDDSLLDATPFLINSVGNVGIGTTGMGAKLSIGSTSQTTFDGSGNIATTSSTSGTDTLNLVNNSLANANIIDASSSSSGLTAPVITATASNSSNTSQVIFSTTAGVGTGATIQHTGSSGSVVRFNDVASDTTPFAIDVTGNVGIGTFTPNAQLDIRNQGVTPFMVNSGATVSTGDYLVVRSDGNVGIGSSAPNSILNIPSLKSTTGTRYLCIGTTGIVTSSAIACAGT